MGPRDGAPTPTVGPGPSWDPSLYRRFGGPRARPFLDLVARVQAEAPRDVVDLGCGPGHLTGLLADRWPAARVRASDSSPDMVAAAREAGVDAEVVDVRDWTPGPETDVVVSNAVLHWVPEHRSLLRRWAGALPAGAWLAVQMPGNDAAPAHALVRSLLTEQAWDVPAAVAEYGIGTPEEYARLLVAARPGSTVDAWETTYAHPLEGTDPVLDWIAGTTLRPVRDALAEDAWTRFCAELAPRLREAYPADADGITWFGFRRVFAVLRCS